MPTVGTGPLRSLMLSDGDFRCGERNDCGLTDEWACV